MPLPPRVALRQMASDVALTALTVAFAFICCPCFLCTVACGLGTCGSGRLLERRRRAALRNTRLHPSLLIAPAPPPAYVTLPGADSGKIYDAQKAHLRRDGNRVFHLRSDNGVLESGNLGAVLDDFEVRKERLVTVLPKEKWKDLLKLLMDTQKEIDKTEEADRKKKKNTMWWRDGVSTKWVKACVEKLEKWKLEDEKGSPEDGGWFEVWFIMMQTPHLNSVLSEMNFHSNTAIEDLGSRIWAKAVMSSSLFLRDQMPVEDFFPGRWNEDYVNGEAEVLRHDEIDNWFRFMGTGPRRSEDSGTREAAEAEEAD